MCRIEKLLQHIHVLILLICVLLNSGYAYMLHDDSIILASLFLMFLIVIFKYGLMKRGLLLRGVYQSPFFLLAAWILLSIVLHFDFNNPGSYIRQAVVLITAVVITSKTDFTKFKIVFLTFMEVVAVLSILTWLAINVLSIKLPFPIMQSTAKNVYYNQYYNGILVFVNTVNHIRIMGPFWEAGVYASMAIFALIILNSLNNLPRKRVIFDIIIFTVSIILSFSTSGYILLVLYYIYTLFEKSKTSTAVILTLIFIIIASIMFIFGAKIVTQLAQAMPYVFNKLTYQNVSSSTRVNGPLVDLAIFNNSPIIGDGMNRYFNDWTYYARVYKVQSRTSTITYFMANYGVAGILYFIELFRGIVKQKELKSPSKFILLLIIIFILSKEPHYVNMLTTMLISYLYFYQLKLGTHYEKHSNQN